MRCWPANCLCVRTTSWWPTSRRAPPKFASFWTRASATTRSFAAWWYASCRKTSRWACSRIRTLLPRRLHRPTAPPVLHHCPPPAITSATSSELFASLRIGHFWNRPLRDFPALLLFCHGEKLYWPCTGAITLSPAADVELVHFIQIIPKLFHFFFSWSRWFKICHLIKCFVPSLLLCGRSSDFVHVLVEQSRLHHRIFSFSGWAGHLGLSDTRCSIRESEPGSDGEVASTVLPRLDGNLSSCFYFYENYEVFWKFYTSWLCDNRISLLVLHAAVTTTFWHLWENWWFVLVAFAGKWFLSETYIQTWGPKQCLEIFTAGSYSSGYNWQLISHPYRWSQPITEAPCSYTF